MSLPVCAAAWGWKTLIFLGLFFATCHKHTLVLLFWPTSAIDLTSKCGGESHMSAAGGHSQQAVMLCQPGHSWSPGEHSAEGVQVRGFLFPSSNSLVLYLTFHVFYCTELMGWGFKHCLNHRVRVIQQNYWWNFTDSIGKK